MALDTDVSAIADLQAPPDCLISFLQIGISISICLPRESLTEVESFIGKVIFLAKWTTAALATGRRSSITASSSASRYNLLRQFRGNDTFLHFILLFLNEALDLIH